MGIQISVQKERKKAYPWERLTDLGNERFWKKLTDVGNERFDRDEFEVKCLEKIQQVQPLRDILGSDSQHVISLERAIKTFYNDASSNVFGAAKISKFILRIADLLQGYEVIYEKELFETREIPLYIFNSPSVDKAKAMVTTKESVGAKADWSIKVMGSGFGSDFTVSITQSSQFTSSSGQCKLIFAPLKVRIVRAALYKHGILEKHFLRTELAESDERDADGIKTLDEKEWAEFTADNQLQERFDLLGDRSNDIATYNRKYSLSGNFNASLGFKALNLESTVSAKVSTEQSVEVSLSLPPGNTYQLMSPSKVSGFFFESE